MTKDETINKTKLYLKKISDNIDRLPDKIIVNLYYYLDTLINPDGDVLHGTSVNRSNSIINRDYDGRPEV